MPNKQPDKKDSFSYVPCEGDSYIECGWSLRGRQ